MTIPQDPESSFGLEPPAAYEYDLGTYSLPIASAAQTWFDRGLNWTYGFHHTEAVRCFRYAIHTDPSCAMAYWGLAYAAGPNYNKWWGMFAPDELAAVLPMAHAAAVRATQLATRPLEKALAGAIAARFPANAGTAEDFSAWNHAYIAAMAGVYEAFGDQLDVAAIYADSMMALAPWQLWDLHTGAPREDSQTLRVKEVLERALGAPGAMAHPGLLHLYIHLMELSPTPEVARAPADALRALVPDAGHLRHMPGHIDLLVGDYARVLSGAADAMAADDKYLAHFARDFYQFYTQHNASFAVYAAMMAGREAPALAACERMERALPDDFLRTPNPPIADWMEGFLTYRVHVLVRFGRWDALLSLPFPEDRAFYTVTTTTVHYGRALALALTDRVAEAEAERDAFRASRTRIQPTRQAFPNQWKDIFDIAEEMLSGEIAYRAGAVEEGFAHLRRSIKLSDNLIYAEPWGWMQPPRHAYGALLLEQGEVQAAAAAYAEDLGLADTVPRALQHPNNVWALHGYHECLVRMGRTDEAQKVKRDLDTAVAGADVPIESSCLCRRVTVKACCEKN